MEWKFLCLDERKMLMSAWNEWKKNIGDSRPWHLLDPDKLTNDDNLVKSRLSECLSCSELIEITKQCAKCGCFVNLKTRLENAKCPIGKW